MSRSAFRAAFATMSNIEQTHMLLQEAMCRVQQYGGDDVAELYEIAAGITADSSDRDCDEAISRGLQILRRFANKTEGRCSGA
jgi:hypothetical protein